MKRLIVQGNLDQIDNDIIQQAFVKLLESKNDRTIETNNYVLGIRIAKVNKTAVLTKK